MKAEPVQDEANPEN